MTFTKPEMTMNPWIYSHFFIHFIRRLFVKIASDVLFPLKGLSSSKVAPTYRKHIFFFLNGRLNFKCLIISYTLFVAPPGFKGGHKMTVKVLFNFFHQSFTVFLIREKYCTHFIRYISKYFIWEDANVNGIVFHFKFQTCIHSFCIL